MAKIATFINLHDGHPEAEKRKQDLEGQLPGHQFTYVNGGAENGTYPSMARNFVLNNLDADVFIATCWPTMNELRQWASVPIVVAGLCDSPGQTYPSVSGLKSFASKELCPFWPALLAAVAPGVTKVAVVYDGDPSRPGMGHQEQVIKTSSPSSFSITNIHADDPAKQMAINPNISGDIATFLQSVGNDPAGLIVTAGTRTTMLRDEIIEAVTARNLSPNKLYAIYPSSIFMDTSGALLAYGPDLRKLYKNVANKYVKPIITSNTAQGLDTNRDFELIVSQKGARDVNLTIPTPPRFDVKLADGSMHSIIGTVVP